MALIKGLFAGLAVLALMALSILLQAAPWALAIAGGIWLVRSCGG